MTVIRQDGTSTPSKQTRLLSHPLAVNSGEDPANFSFLGYGQSYSQTSPYVPQSPFLLLVHHRMSPHRSMTVRAGVDQDPQPTRQPLLHSTSHLPGPYQPTVLSHLAILFPDV